MGPAARVMVAAMLLGGCAIDALVGENPDVSPPRDTAVVATTADLPPPVDAPAIDLPPPIDAATPDLPPPLDAPSPDFAAVPDAVREDARQRDSTSMMSGAGFDAATDTSMTDVADAATDAIAIAAETATAVDANALDDSSTNDDLPLLPDTGLGRTCRRDADCAGDPFGPFCSMLHSRCAATR